MQKKIMAAAVAALCGVATTAVAQQAAPQQAGGSKVQLWGIVDAAVRHTNNEGADKKSLTKMIGGGMSQSRFGINVEEDLGNGSKALVVLENRFTTDDGNTTPVTPAFFQLAYVGLQTPYGRLTMGRQYNVLFDVVTSTYASFPYSPYMDAYKPELGMAAGARASNALKYSIATPDRTWVATAQYSFAEGNTSKKAEDAAVALAQAGLGNAALLDNPLATPGLIAALNGPANPALATQTAAVTKAVTDTATGAYKTAGAFLRYSKNGISVGGGFMRTYLPGGSDLDAWTLGGSYRKDKLYVNLGYGENKFKSEGLTVDGTPREFATTYARSLIDKGIVNSMWQGQTNGGFQMGDADKRKMLKVGFGYQITPQINAGLHYYHAKQSGSVSGEANGKANFMIAAANYAFSKRTDAYLAVDHTKVSGGNSLYIDPSNQTKKRTGLTVGLRHRF